MWGRIRSWPRADFEDVTRLARPPVGVPVGMADAGLSDGPSQTDASAPAAAAEVASERISDRSCATDVIFTTGLRYETDEASVLDVAISKASAPGKRPAWCF